MDEENKQIYLGEEAVGSKPPISKSTKVEDETPSKMVFETMTIDKSINYQGIDFKITSTDKIAEASSDNIISLDNISLEERQKIIMSTAPQVQKYKTLKASGDKEFLAINIEAKNNSSEQVFVFYDEVRLISESGEADRLIDESGETIALENYDLETIFEPNFESEGFLLFSVAKESTKFKLLFGRKNMPEVELNFEINEDSIVKTEVISYVTELDFNPQSLRDITELPEGEEIFEDKPTEGEIPANSKIRIAFEIFCLDEGKIGPDINEPYFFSYTVLDMPMCLKIMKYFREHPETLTVIEGEVEFLDLRGKKVIVKSNQTCTYSKEQGLQGPFTLPFNLKEQIKT